MTARIVNLDSVEFDHEHRHGERFEARLAMLGAKLGARRLGFNVTAVPPGKRAFPLHNHHGLEELFLVLAGSGTLRYGVRESPVRAGDLIACPAGGPETAHQLINTGEEELRFLAISDMPETDVVQYPDSGKFGAVAGLRRGEGRDAAAFRGFYDEARRKDYWDGE